MRAAQYPVPFAWIRCNFFKPLYVVPTFKLKVLLLISLYSISSERALCQELDHNLLYRCFLDMDLMEPSFQATVFTRK